MNRILTPLSVAALLAASVLAQEPAKKRITVEDYEKRRASFSVQSPRVSWVANDKLLRVSEPSLKKKKIAAVVRDPRTWKVSPGKPEDAASSARVPDRTKPRLSIGRRSGQVMLREPGKDARPITKDPARKREAHLSPNQRYASYVRDNNLVVRDLAQDEEWTVTADGGPERFHGVLDWVYQEEIYGRGDFQAHWWSPTGRHVAFLSLDESPVKEFTVIDHVPHRQLDKERGVTAEITNYPKAGDPNPFVSLSVADVVKREVVTVDLSRYPKDMLVVSIDWTPDGHNVVYQVQNRVQTWLELGYANPVTGVAKTLIREESPTWVNVLEPPRWLGDRTFLWWSERTGYKHLYHYDEDGKLLSQVTKGDFPVRRILKLDEARRKVWFSASPDFPCDQHAFRVGLGGEGQKQLTHGRGTHRVSLNFDGSMFTDTFSSVTTPPEVRVCDGEGDIIRTLPSTPLQSDYEYCPKELHVVEARDGFPLDATVIKPAGFDESKSYPVWIETYSGPAAPSVRNGWRVTSWHQFLAHQGVIVLQVNVRTASAAGQKVVGLCHKQFCVQELRDLEDTVKWLTANSWADEKRVGLTGWSYGGTMTAYALTHSKLFRVGIAGAGVYDWQLYDTIYTERYMDTPQSNPKGYAKSSCLAAAKDLHGYLVLVHGTMDDNVHLQNTIRFAGELQRFGKDFEMMLYPDSRHGVGSPQQRRHLQQLRWKIIERELLPG